MTSPGCSLARPPRAVVFDLDGTLIDSLDDIVAALAGALVDHGLAPPCRDTVRGWIGDGARNLVTRALADGATASVDDVLAGFQERYRLAPTARTRLYPGVAEALDRFTERGQMLAVLSNKPHPLTVRIADELLGNWPFVVIFGQRPGVPLKPDPTGALAIALELGLPPAMCAFVGDSEIDIATARHAEMIPVGVTWGFRPRFELEAAEPTVLVDTAAQLVEALLS